MKRKCSVYDVKQRKRIESACTTRVEGEEREERNKTRVCV